MRNLFLDQRRAAARRPVEAVDPEDLERLDRSVMPGPQAAVETREVFAAVSGLPDDFRDVIVAVDIVGLSYKEAAKSLKIAEGTVMSRLYRARGRVAKELGATA
jgi:RNA polymerase sigma-70 factor (ECF subfamily)